MVDLALNSHRDSLVKLFSDGDEAQLTQIVADGNERLEAQFTSLQSGNQRAMTFFGFLVTAESALVGALGLNDAGGVNNIPLVFSVIGIAIAGFFAFLSFRPKVFYTVGITPSNWANDIREKKAPIISLAEKAVNIDERIKKNSDTLGRNSILIEISIGIAAVTLITSAVWMGTH